MLCLYVRPSKISTRYHLGLPIDHHLTIGIHHQPEAYCIGTEWLPGQHHRCGWYGWGRDWGTRGSGFNSLFHVSMSCEQFHILMEKNRYSYNRLKILTENFDKIYKLVL